MFRTTIFCAAAALAVAVSEPAAAQCRLASVQSYGTGNPVRLATEFPGEYVVPGTQTIYRAQATEPVSVLLLSGGRTSQALPPAYVGDLLVDLGHLIADLPAAWPDPKWVLGVPSTVALGVPLYAQSAHIGAAGIRLSNGLESIVGRFEADIEITGIDVPAILIGGNGSPPYRVHFRNLGPAAVNFTTTVTVGPNWGRNGANVGAFGSGFVDVLVPTPPISGSPGSFVDFTVQACSDLFDCNPSNSCRSTSARVYFPYWDLHLSIEDAPSSVCVGFGTWFTYRVRVSNVGNIPSQGFGFMTGINCSPGAGQWGCQPNATLFGNGANLLPNQSAIYPFSYFVPGHTWRQTQWLKAEINYGDIFLIGNYADRPISIGC